VLTPNKETFFDEPSTFQNVLNLATSLYHFHEWLYTDFQAKLEEEFGAQFASPGAFWREVERRDARFGYFRDAANLSKHVKIGEPGRPRPSTDMTHIANTVIVTTGMGRVLTVRASTEAGQTWSLKIREGK
jgi:hypothetical protein